MARTPRKWQGARTPSGLKRVRQAERRRAILQPRRSAAKTLVAKAVTVATSQPDGQRRRDQPQRGDLGPRPRRQGGRDPPERRRAPQVAPHAQGQRRRRRLGRPDAPVTSPSRPARPPPSRPPRPASPPARPSRPRVPRRPPARPAPRCRSRPAPTRRTPRPRPRRRPRPATTTAAKPAAKATTTKKAPAKASATKAAPKAAAKTTRQGDDRQGHRREGRAEDDEGQEGRVVARSTNPPTPRSSAGAFRIPGGDAPRVRPAPWSRVQAAVGARWSSGRRRFAAPYISPPPSAPPTLSAISSPALAACSRQ